MLPSHSESGCSREILNLICLKGDLKGISVGLEALSKKENVKITGYQLMYTEGCGVGGA